jgi:hypothetical protein
MKPPQRNTTFADAIVVNAKNLPDNFTPLSDWRDLKKVYKEVSRSNNSPYYPEELTVIARRAPKSKQLRSWKQ